MPSKTVKEEVVEQVAEEKKPKEKEATKKLSLHDIKRAAMIRNIDEDTLLDLLLLNGGDMTRADEMFSEVKTLVKGSYLPSKTIVKYMKYIRM